MAVKDENSAVLLSALLDLIIRRGTSEPNLFRTSRSIHDVRRLYELLIQITNDEDARGDDDLVRKLAEEGDIHLVSAVVMHHLKVTPCLIPTRLYDQVIEADLTAEDDELRTVALRSLLQSMPSAEWKQLKALVRFLGTLAQSAHLNELPVQSLAFLFAPLLTRPEGSAYMSVRHLQGLGKLRQVLQLLIELSDEVFAETGAVLVTSQTATVTMLHAPVTGVEVVNVLLSNIVTDFVGGKSDGQRVMCADSHVPASEIERSHGNNVYCRWEPARKTMAHERRRMVQACRTLRVQIKRFEDCFQRQHGHLPKGTERAPLASTYCQYREWKKNIRDHAAAQVQALFRGWSARAARQHQDPPSQPPRRLSAAPLHDRLPDGPNENRILQHPSADVTDIASLMQQKKLIKLKLKSFDQEFAAAHGRMPTKSEKEPIRDLYELYHGIKLRIKMAEDFRRSGTVVGAPTAEFGGIASDASARGGGNQTMRQLELERQRLHDKLKLYEKQFQRNHGRPVTSVEDIAPVAPDYSRYRELKRIGNATAEAEYTKVGGSIRC